MFVPFHHDVAPCNNNASPNPSLHDQSLYLFKYKTITLGPIEVSNVFGNHDIISVRNFPVSKEMRFKYIIYYI